MTPSPSSMVERITHEEAREIAQRLINSHFNQDPHARVSIPARPEYDDDIRIMVYIEQQATPIAAQEVDLEAKRLVDLIRAEVPDSHPPRFKLFDKDAIAAVAAALRAAPPSDFGATDLAADLVGGWQRQWSAVNHVRAMADLEDRIAALLTKCRSTPPSATITEAPDAGNTGERG